MAPSKLSAHLREQKQKGDRTKWFHCFHWTERGCDWKRKEMGKEKRCVKFKVDFSFRLLDFRGGWESTVYAFYIKNMVIYRLHHKYSLRSVLDLLEVCVCFFGFSFLCFTVTPFIQRYKCQCPISQYTGKLVMAPHVWDCTTLYSHLCVCVCVR